MLDCKFFIECRIKLNTHTKSSNYCTHIFREWQMNYIVYLYSYDFNINLLFDNYLMTRIISFQTIYKLICKITSYFSNTKYQIAVYKLSILTIRDLKVSPLKILKS